MRTDDPGRESLSGTDSTCTVPVSAYNAGMSWIRILLPTSLVGALSACIPLYADTPLNDNAQRPPTQVTRHYYSAEAQRNFDSLLAQFGRNKSLPPGFELQALLALSHYPELADIHIEFIVADVAIPLASRPWWGSMHRHARKRHYKVIIDSQRDDRTALLLGEQPFNAQVGIIGHELAHTVYYLDRSFLEIAADALCQLSTCRIGFERATDARLVRYGLGWQRYDHAVFLREAMGRPVDDRLPDTPGAYLSPGELLALMDRDPAYHMTLANHPGYNVNCSAQSNTPTSAPAVNPPQTIACAAD